MKRTRTFKSGNSVAVRLPKSLGVDAGVEMTVREERGRYIVEPVTEERGTGKKIDLTGIFGSMAPGTIRRDADLYEDIPREWHLLGLDPE